MSHVDATPQTPQSGSQAIPQWAIDAADRLVQLTGWTDAIDVFAAIIARHAPAGATSLEIDLAERNNRLQHDDVDKEARIAELEAENTQLRVGIAKLLVSSLAAQGRDLDELRSDPILAKHYPAEVFGAKLLGEM